MKLRILRVTALSLAMGLVPASMALAQGTSTSSGSSGSTGGTTAGSSGTKTAAKSFGQPVLFSTSNQSSVKGVSSSTTLNNTSNSGQGFTTLQLPKSIAYQTSLSEDVPMVMHAPSAMQQRLAGVL